VNINFTVTCDTCGENTNLRIGLSNRDAQPLRFACPCGAPIDIIMGGPDHGIVGATKVQGKEPFDAETNFVDLHLDFPVSFEKYEMGMTPYMRAVGRIGVEEMAIHTGRLNFLNANRDEVRRFATLLKLYRNAKILPFKLNAKKSFNIDLRSERPEDVNLALYDLIARMMGVFALPSEAKVQNDVVTKAIHDIHAGHAEAMVRFVTEVVDTGFLANLQADALEIYPRIWDAELPLRPALFLDFDEAYAENPIPMRVSADAFETYKDLFKDITELISRLLVLVAGLNNIAKRGDHDKFAPKAAKDGKPLEPANLNAYADVELGRKDAFIDDSWFELIDGPVDNQLRNAIAHNKAEYDDVTQRITYFPSREGMRQEKAKEIYFLGFMRQLLIAYRNMHQLHRLVKNLFFYNYLMMKRA
jgi:hypothetical protein